MENAEKASFVTDPVSPFYTHPYQAPAADLHPESYATQFVDKHRRLLIGKVKNVKPIQDFLLEKEVITRSDHVDLSLRTGEDTMRKLYDDLLNSNASKQMFYQALQIHERYLVDNIGVEEVELAKKDRFMICSLVCGTVGAGLLWAAVYYSGSFGFVAGGGICSLGLLVAVGFLSDFCQLPRRSVLTKTLTVFQRVGGFCQLTRLKDGRPAGVHFCVSTFYTFVALLIWTGVAVYFEAQRLIRNVAYELAWSSVPFTFLAGIFYCRAYGPPIDDDEGDGGEEEVERETPV